MKMKFGHVVKLLLVFLTIAVVGIFNTSYAQQVYECDSYCRDKLQKQNRKKFPEKMYLKTDNIRNYQRKIRIRALSGSSSQESVSTDISSLNLIWGNWGIGTTSENFLNTKSGYTFKMQAQFTDLSYTLGESWTATFGLGIPSGTGQITNIYNTDEYKTSTVSGYGYFAVFGLEIGIFEFLVGHRINNVEYSKFESSLTTLDSKYKVSGGQYMIGLGLSF